MADYLILFTILFVVALGLAALVIWWKLSSKESGKFRHKHAKPHRGNQSAADGSALPMRGTGRTLAELGMKK